MKVGDKVRCIEPDGLGILTLNKEYVISDIEDDGGDPSHFLCEVEGIDEVSNGFFPFRFELIEECKAEPPVNGMVVNEKGGVKEVVGKLRWTLLPINALREVVKVLEYGATKYSPDNWQKVDKERYHEALWRHWTAYCDGEKVDPETGISHMAHLICDALFILWFDLTGKGNASK